MVSVTSSINIINGTGDADYIPDTSANDSISGLGGDDTIQGFGGGGDTIDGGDGNDSIWDTVGNNSISGGEGNDTIVSYGGAETLSGGAGDDSIASSAYGEARSTTIDGGEGNDILSIYSQDGAPLLATGGHGSDVYVIETPYTADGNATVTDFTAGAGGDVIDLSSVVTNLSNYDGGDPLASGHVRIVQSGSDTLIQVDADASGVIYNFHTALVLQNVNAASLTADNFRGYTFDGSALAGSLFTGTGDAETLNGSHGDDTLLGLAGDDSLFGDGGNDSLNGGDGNDTLDGYLGSDRIDGGAGDDVISDHYGQNTIHGGDGNDLIWLGGQGTSYLYGDAGNDTFQGSFSTAFMSSSANILTGGDGSDTYYLSPGNTPVTITDFAPGAGGDIFDLTPTLLNAFHYTTGANPFADGHVKLVQSGADVLIQFDPDGSANPGWDYRTIAILKNVDAATLTSENFGGFSPADTPHNETITGTAGNDGLTGHGGDDILWGLAGNDTLNGGPGADTLHGGAGNDTYIVDNADDVVSETEAGGADSGGIDTVLSSTWTYTLTDHVENLILADGTGFGFGNALNNVITGNAANNFLEGYDGNDTLNGNDGDDTLFGDGGANLLNGGAGNDYLYGSTGNETLDGGAGDDSMYGGEGNDIYYVDSAGDQVFEFASSGGADRVYASIDYTLGDYVENLNLTGSAGLSGTGNSLNNGMNGNSGNNHLWGLGGNDVMNGGAGADTMYGGSGDDTYIVDNTGDIASEESAGAGTNDGGTDLVQASVSFTLGNFIENLTLTGAGNIAGTGNGLANLINGNAGNNTLYGFDGNDKLYGNDGNDMLYGGAGNDTLDGGAGFDIMQGGAGSDVYYVSDAGDFVSENAGDVGTDLVVSTVSYSLGNFIENLNLAGTADIFGNGNALDNVINGNAGANALLGLDGNDQLNGNAGADTINGGDGNDTVNGGADNDLLYGNAGYDTLDGGTGADTMYGGAGNDIYYVDNIGDVVLEESTGAGVNDGGGDRVMSTISYTLGNFIENLNLLGTADLNGTGNSLANGLNGNTGNNVLSGLGGNDTLNGSDGADTLIGGQGNDVLNGGNGADTFVFAAAGTANGLDTVQDFVHGADVLRFTGADYGFSSGHLLTASEFTAGSAAVGASAQFIWNAATHTLYWDHDGAGGDAAVAIATFNGGATVTASDFHFG
ncbi:beta strand repeat-containing protein [Asticcacaulis solisilvae]|uniref:beta strand repeat-containing protein n=1 Tax=Asticcacaulis solisilvae TaxID=1217274 RepID=UPI003FD770AD